MSESTGGSGDYMGPQTAPSDGGSARNTPEVEVMEVAPGKSL